jgi:hypothetical protein
VSGLLYDPEEWRDILAALKDGRDDAALNILRQRDMRADGKFQVIDEKSFTPSLSQVTTAQTVDCAFPVVEGIRIGPWVQLNVQVAVTGTGAGSGDIYMSLPDFLPVQTYTHRPVGTFYVLDWSPLGSYTGAAISGTALGYVMIQSVGITLAVDDIVGYSIQYLVDPTAL